MIEFGLAWKKVGLFQGSRFGIRDYLMPWPGSIL